MLKMRVFSFFGARQTGKTTLLKQLFPHVRYYDLLKSDEE